MASTDAGPPQLPAAAPEITISSSSSSSFVDVIRHTVPLPKTSPSDVQKIKDEVFKHVMNGKWEVVERMYTNHKLIIQTAKITKSKDTAVHIAIADNKIEAAKNLLNIVDPARIMDMKNERDNNPLHLAAARGQVGSIDHVFLIHYKQNLVPRSIGSAI